MNGFAPGLMDRLLGDHDRPVSLEQYKDSVARDLEDLLNTRCAVPEEWMRAYPECTRSIANYGLVDFAGMCLSSADDRARICAALKTAIERHEPRLRNVQARLEREAGDINRVSFAIYGTLAGLSYTEAVSFDAVLQPSSLHYSINRSTRGARK
ncbi:MULTISPECIES: type VI secretion system baseplate subunit TssE [unclassified Duganella]|jgi:type VI secretion system protein ImpF|uniref:type VI secretion system baseplate subunit TssE n=1 Tax=unclassified Duganella TaxID=2636909 RepID=UPI0008819477|nr:MULTISPECIES: type VI secretion system baseplate subunit TssE [unclassified Duganella]SDF46171.1 type VI secretion system protein ImpF [Duganella sp. OV458]SDI80642.1 type VI secretion system protein ImpF [Duganella sp. OV510]